MNKSSLLQRTLSLGLSVALGFALAVPLAPFLAEARTSQAVQALTPSKDYRTLVSQRQTVDMLIAEALQAFKSPARVSHAGYTGKLATNMEIVADRLLLAADLEPYRADLLFSAASAFIANGDVDKAIDVYERILTLAPQDTDAHTYLAAWQRFSGNRAASDSHLQALDAYAPRRAADIRDVFAIIDRVTAKPIVDRVPTEMKSASGPVAVVTLGYALNPDGTMHQTLVDRLNKTLEVAKALPGSLIVVTGGVPQNNQTEARLMAEWLVNKGIPASRIVEDNAARSTVENALFSRYALTRHGITDCVVLSSGSHVRRAETLFTIACRESGPQGIRFYAVGAPDKPIAELQPLTQGDLRGIYRDALKTMGLWSFRSYPLEER